MAFATCPLSPPITTVLDALFTLPVWFVPCNPSLAAIATAAATVTPEVRSVHRFSRRRDDGWARGGGRRPERGKQPVYGILRGFRHRLRKGRDERFVYTPRLVPSFGTLTAEVEVSKSGSIRSALPIQASPYIIPTEMIHPAPAFPSFP